MRENNRIGQSEEKDFVSNVSFKSAVKKMKIKQFLLYFLVSLTTIILVILGISILSNILIHNKIDTESKSISKNYYNEPTIGAGIIDVDTIYLQKFLSAEQRTTYYKRIGDRKIPWKIDIKKIPAIGKVENMNPTRIETYEISNKERTIRYNPLNNEREVDFYYPHIGYHNLPQELEIATGLSENTVIEIALSFEKTMSFNDLGRKLGIENVEWLWIVEQNKVFSELGVEESDFDHILYGENAYGYSVSKTNPYTTFKSNEKIGGAIVSGTPTELKKFLELDIIRASVIGATIDKY